MKPLPGQALTPEDLARIHAQYGPTTKPRVRVPCTCIGGWDENAKGDPVRCTRCIGSPGWVEEER